MSSTDSYGPLAPLDDGLGFLPGSACPHYFGEPGRRAAYRRWVATRALGDGYAVDEYAAIVWRDGVPSRRSRNRPIAPCSGSSGPKRVSWSTRSPCDYSATGFSGRAAYARMGGTPGECGPEAMADEIDVRTSGLQGGFGSVKVRVTIGSHPAPAPAGNARA